MSPSPPGLSDSGSFTTPSALSQRPILNLAGLSFLSPPWSEPPLVPHLDYCSGLSTGLQESTLASLIYRLHHTVVRTIVLKHLISSLPCSNPLPLPPTLLRVKAKVCIWPLMFYKAQGRSLTSSTSCLVHTGCFSNMPDLVNGEGGPHSLYNRAGIKPRPSGFWVCLMCSSLYLQRK